MALFELPETAQEVFDIVKSHLLSQNKKCEIRGTCRYRHGGLKCAAGVLIPEEHYNRAFEDMLWSELVSMYNFPSEHSRLILRLQRIHDMSYPDKWEEELKRAADFYNLNY